MLGIASEIDFNFWNVMEYSIGFFGGAGMAYGTFTADWPQKVSVKVPSRSWFPIAMLVLIIPLVVWDQSFGTERVQKMLTAIDPENAGMLTELTQTSAFLAIVGAGLYWFFHFYLKSQPEVFTFKFLFPFFLAHFTLYVACSWLITGAFLSTYRPEQYLYLINLLIVGFLFKKVDADFELTENRPGRWAILLAMGLVVVAVAALIAINSHEVWERANQRF